MRCGIRASRAVAQGEKEKEENKRRAHENIKMRKKWSDRENKYMTTGKKGLESSQARKLVKKKEFTKSTSHLGRTNWLRRGAKKEKN